MVLNRHDSQLIQWPPRNTSFEPKTKFLSISAIVSGTEIWVPQTGRRIVLVGAMISSEASNNITLKGENRGDFIEIPLEDIDNFDHAGGQSIWVGEIGEKLLVDTSTTGQSFITLYGHEDS